MKLTCALADVCLPDYYYSAIRAVMCDVQPRDRGAEYPFRDLDSSEDDGSESVYAYFVFIRED